MKHELQYRFRCEPEVYTSVVQYFSKAQEIHIHSERLIKPYVRVIIRLTDKEAIDTWNFLQSPKFIDVEVDNLGVCNDT